jgi:hypothetical protein
VSVTVFTREQILSDIWVRRALQTATLADEGVRVFAQYSRTFNEARVYFKSLPATEVTELRVWTERARAQPNQCCRRDY